MSDKKPSGSEFRKRRKHSAEQDAERERDRGGLNGEWAALLEKIGTVPLDPVGNSEWANNMAAGMAAIIARDETIPLPERFKRVAELIDRVAYSQGKASTAKRIREVKEGAGIPVVKDRHADGVEQIGAGASLRARGNVRGAVAVSGPVPSLSPQEDSQGTAASRREMGPDPKKIH